MSIFEFRRNVRIACPFCLGDTPRMSEGDPCPDCDQHLPLLYRRKHSDLPLLPIQTLGWSGHGKTVLLTALSLVLERMSVVWPEFTWAAATDTSQRHLADLHRLVETGALPPPTPLDGGPCHVFIMEGVPEFGARTLTFRDIAGELFDRLSVPPEAAPFLARVPTILLVASPHDLARDRTRTVDGLLTAYRTSLEEQGVALGTRDGKRRLVVVLTKADLIPDLWDEIRDHLVSDRLWARLNHPKTDTRLDLEDPRTYLDHLEQISDRLREWLEPQPQWRNLIRLAESQDLEPCFCIVSGTGGAVLGDGTEDRHLESRWAPRRILDPLLWTLHRAPRRFSITSWFTGSGGRSTGPAFQIRNISTPES